jgi:hypothetical protein
MCGMWNAWEGTEMHPALWLENRRKETSRGRTCMYMRMILKLPANKQGGADPGGRQSAAARLLGSQIRNPLRA